MLSGINNTVSIKIAVVAPEVHKHGGTEKALAYLIESLSGKHNVFLLSANVKDLAPDVLKSIKVYKIPAPLRPSLISHLAFFILSSIYLIFIKITKKIDIVLTAGPDCVFSDISVVQYCHLERLKLIKNKTIKLESKTLSQKFKNIYYKIYYHYTALAEKIFYEFIKPKLIISVSNGIKENFIKYKLADENNIVVIPNPVDLNDFNINKKQEYRIQIRKLHKIGQDEVILLFVGRGEWNRKGLVLIFDALNYINSPVRLFVVGGKENISMYKTIAEEKNIAEKVIFAGDSDEVYKYFAAGDIFVFPSYFEAFALVTLEASAMGLPLVVSKINGTEDLVIDGFNGLFVSHDGHNIAEKINYLLENPEKIKEMGDNSLKVISNYDIKTINEKIVKAIESLI